MAYEVSYQISLGSYFFAYIAQVGNPAQNTIGVFFFWFWVLFIVLITGPLVARIGIAILFLIFSVCALGGAVYFWFFMRPTEGLSKEEIKVLYAPKTQTEISGIANSSYISETEQLVLAEDKSGARNSINNF